MKTADKRGKEKKHLSDYFELTEQTYENPQDSLFTKKKRSPSLLKTVSKSKQNPKPVQLQCLPKSGFGDHHSVTNALDVSNTHAGVILG